MIKKIMYFLLAVNSLLIAEDTVLVPIGNDKYERVPISDIIIAEELLDSIQSTEEPKIPIYTKDNIVIAKDQFSLKDILDISLTYQEKIFDRKSLENNKNYYQNRVADIFLDNSKIKKSVYQDEYSLALSLFNYSNEYEKDNKKMKNKGISIGTQYGLTDNWNLNFTIGYMDSKIKTKSKDLYSGVDLNYNSRSVADETEYSYGVKLGYLNSDSIKEYKVNDMFIGLLYYNMNIPLTTDLSSQIGYETSIISNKLNLGLNQNIWINNDIELNIILDGNYVFGYKDRDKKIYTHLDEDKINLNIKTKIKYKNLEITPKYELINNNIGLSFKYCF
ncbi:hypothetical protein [Fusobacterium sp. SYSU M8D902]|uniref:hypothetical protein n=1 Tax=Fusobacterium sp. SYSU M8D902 TaxID=3159562 RepID=UPI0032E458B5